MRTFFIGFVVFLLYAIPARWHYTCQIRNLCGDKEIEILKVPNHNQRHDLSVKVEDSTLLANYDQFGFLPNSAELNLTDNNKEFLKGIADYLKKNESARLSIIGNYFGEEEVTSGTYDNLGLARAAAIRTHFVSEYGFDIERFKLDYQEVEKGDKVYVDRPVEYDIIVPNIKPVAKGDEVLTEPSYTFERMTFSDINFEYNSDKFTPSNSFSVYADSVKKYLDLFPEKKLTIVGHADNRGTDDYNYGLGLSRANNVIIYLRDKKEIDIERISSDSKGEKQPIVPNTTEANHRKNRRVEVIIE